jgi:predicted GIY-YIG superfamily endonuclease
MANYVAMYVYVVHRPVLPMYSKIGITSDLNNRLRGYLTALPERDIQFFQTWRVRDRSEALRVERNVLRDGRAAGFGARGEWLNMSPAVVAGMVEDDLREWNDQRFST